MLSFDQIMPAIESLAELYSRPKTNARIASQNQKVALVLRKKIASSVLQGLAGKDQALQPKDIKKLQNEFIDNMGTAILNMTLIASVGIDFSDLTFDELKKIRKSEDATSLLIEIKKMRDSEGNPLLDTFFEGTEVVKKKVKEMMFQKLYNQSKKLMDVSLKYLIKNIQKEVERKKKTGDFVDGTLTSEFVTTILIDSLTGRDDASDEENVFELTGLRKKMSAKSVFKIIYDEAMRFRKSFAKGNANGSVVVGKGKFSWLKKSKKILGCMRNFNHKMWSIVGKELRKGSATSFGALGQGEETYQEIQDRVVADSYADLISTMQSKEIRNEDTQERRSTLVEARQEYQDDPSHDNLKDYVLRVLDLINGKVKTIPTETDCRLLLDNIEVISGSNRSMYKKIRGLAYDRLFRVGQLTDSEVQLLDGVYSERELWKEKQKIAKIFDMKGFVQYFDDDFGFDGISCLATLMEAITSLSNDVSSIYDFLSGLKDILKYAPSNLHLKNHVATYEYLADTLQKEQDEVLNLIGEWLNTFQNSEDIQEDLLPALLQDEQSEIENDISSLTSLYNDLLDVRKEIVSLLSSKNSYKPTEDDEWSGGSKLEGSHPLMSYSIHDYPLTAKQLDAGRSTGKVGSHVQITAFDLRVFEEIKDALSTDAGFKERAGKLSDQRSLVNELVDAMADVTSFVSKAKLKVMQTDINKGRITDQDAVKKANDENQRLESNLKSYFPKMKVRFDDFFGQSQEQDEIFVEIDKLIAVPQSEKKHGVAVKKVIKMVQDLYDVDYSKKMRQLFEDNMDGAISVVLQEVLENETSEADRRGKKVLEHRANSDRVKRFLQRDASMVIFQEMTRDSLVKKGSGKKAEATQLKNAKDVAVQAKEKAEELGFSFEEVCKEVGLKTNAKGEALIKNTKDVSALRKVIKELVKKDQENTVDSFIDRAKAMTEADVQTKLDSINSKIGSAISDFKDSMRANILLSQLNRYLSQGFINKAKKAMLDLKEFGEEQITSLINDIKSNTKSLNGIDVKTQARQDGLTEKELQDEINESLKILQDKKKSLITVKSFKKLLDDLREINIIGTIYTFEDRLENKLKAQTTQEIEEITAQRDERLNALNKKKKSSNLTNEEASELRLIEAGEDETFGAKLKKKYLYQRYGISEAKANEVEIRGLNRTFTPYAPVVEQKEETIREKARKMVQKAVDQNISFDELGLGQTYEYDNLRTLGTGKGVLGVADLKGVASRTRSLRKFMGLKKRFSDGNKFEKILEADVDLRPLANVIEASPDCFPSVDLSLDHGLLKVYLAMPYFPNNVLVQKSGEFYALRTSNVFADPLVERNMQALMRYLIASTNPLVISNGGDEVGYFGVEPSENPQLEDFYKNFVNSPSAGAFKELSDDYQMLMGELEIDENSALRKEYLAEYEEQKEWWSGSYTDQEMIEAHDQISAGTRNAKLEEMVRKIVGVPADETLVEDDYNFFENTAYNIVYKNKVDKAKEQFYSTQGQYGHSINYLLGNGLGDFLTASESKALSKELRDSTSQDLVTSDILGEKFGNRVTGRLVLNFTGLIADLNVLLACASSRVSKREMGELEIDPDCVEKVREIFGAEIGELDKIVEKG